MLKENSGIFVDDIYGLFNESTKTCTFSYILKITNITLVFKERYRGSEENYRLLSILPVIKKVFEKVTLQITIFMDSLLSKYQCGFRKGFSAQHCLLTMPEKWKDAFDKGKVFWAFLKDLSKLFDCLSHELITVELNAYGFNLPVLKVMHSYLSNRKPCTKVNHAYSSCEEILLEYHKALYLGLFCLNSL